MSTLDAALVPVVSTKNMDRKEWLALRQKGIGGSDIGAIAGLSPYRSALDVFLEKMGEAEEREETDAMLYGTLVEPVVAEFARRKNPQWQIESYQSLIVHPQHPWAIGNIDRLVTDPARGQGIMEIKTGNIFRLSDWDNEDAPSAQKAQLYWYQGISGASWGVMAGLIGGANYRQFIVEFDAEIFGYLLQIGEEFWHHVETQTPPPLDGGAASTKLANALWRQSRPGVSIALPSEAAALIAQFRAAKTEVAEATARKDAAENRLKQLLGDAESGEYPGYRVTWKTVESHRWDTKALEKAHPDLATVFKKVSISRPFTIKPTKEAQ